MFDAHNPNETSAVGTVEAITPSWEDRATQFKAFQRKTAEAIVAMGKIVYEAKQDLFANDFKQFIAETELNGSTERKYECIGRCAPVFNQYLDRLPANWTSLYDLTKIDDLVVLEEVLVQDRVCPQMTGKDIKDLLVSLGLKSSILNKKPSPPSKPVDAGYTLSIRFARTPSIEVVRKLEQLIKDFTEKNDLPADLSLSDLLSGLLQTMESEEGELQ